MAGELTRKLTRWMEAGIISADQSGQIEAFERTRKSGSFQKQLSHVALFAILLGVASMIGANWQIIPYGLKLALHFAVNAGLAAYIIRLDGATQTRLRDLCVIALSALFLTFIALIAQTYQLHGELYQTMLFWLAICTPLIWYWGRSYIVAWPWLVASYVILYWSFFKITHGHNWMTVAALSALYLPVGLLIASKTNWLLEHRPGFAQAFRRLGLVMPAVFATLGVAMLYIPRGGMDLTECVIGLALGLLLIFALFRPKDRNEELSFHLFMYLIISYILYMLPFALPGEVHGRLLSAILFILYWGYMAFLGARVQMPRLMDLGIQLVAVRLFIIFLEVFGTLMFTGIGLVASGILLLILIRNRAKLLAFGQKLVRYEI